jgi:hypothetical protein
MGKSAFDFDDIQAAENRRKEIAVLGGSSPRVERYRDSPLKKMMREYFEETKTKTEPKFREYVESHPLPYYNFVSDANPEADQDAYNKRQKENKEAADKSADLLEEANENEYKVTDTSTGLPKAEPVLDEEEQELLDKRKKRAIALRQKEATVRPTTVLHTSVPSVTEQQKNEQKSDAKK